MGLPNLLIVSQRAKRAWGEILATSFSIEKLQQPTKAKKSMLKSGPQISASKKLQNSPLKSGPQVSASTTAKKSMLKSEPQVSPSKKIKMQSTASLFFLPPNTNSHSPHSSTLSHSSDSSQYPQTSTRSAAVVCIYAAHPCHAVIEPFNDRSHVNRHPAWGDPWKLAGARPGGLKILMF